MRLMQFSYRINRMINENKSMEKIEILILDTPNKVKEYMKYINKDIHHCYNACINASYYNI